MAGRGSDGDRGVGAGARGAKGYGNPYFKKGLEKLRWRARVGWVGRARKTERILISLENEEKTF